jgi:hypothetical protein
MNINNKITIPPMDPMSAEQYIWRVIYRIELLSDTKHVSSDRLTFSNLHLAKLDLEAALRTLNQ